MKDSLVIKLKICLNIMNIKQKQKVVKKCRGY